MSAQWSLARRPRPPKGSGLPMQQHPAFGRAWHALGTEALWLEWREGKRIRASAQVLRRHWPLVGHFAMLARGPVFAPDVEVDAARRSIPALIDALCAGHRGVIVTPERIEGGDPLDGAGLLRMVTGAHEARLSLAPGLDTLRAQLDPKWRNTLRQAEARAPAIRSGPMPPDPDHWLFRNEAAQARARRYARLPAAFAAAWARHGETLLVEATDATGPVAGMLFLIHLPWASYHIAWTSERGRAARVHHLMLWRAIDALKARGVTALDLGGLDTVTTPGLARFKLGTGAAPVPLGATWMQAPGTRAFACLVPKRFDAALGATR